MCKCTPEIRTPFCGRPGCEWPEQVTKPKPSDLEKKLIELGEEKVAVIQFLARYRNSSVVPKTDHTEKQAAILDRLIEKLTDQEIELMRKVYT